MKIRKEPVKDQFRKFNIGIIGAQRIKESGGKESTVQVIQENVPQLRDVNFQIEWTQSSQQNG